MAAVTRALFEYALLRVVPDPDRGECLNIGVVLHCQAHEMLELQVHLDQDRLRALAPELDIDGVWEAARSLQRTCQGEGPAAELSLGQRFRWLTAPRSTMVQAGPAHTGLTDEPGRELERLLGQLVR